MERTRAAAWFCQDCAVEIELICRFDTFISASLRHFLGNAPRPERECRPRPATRQGEWFKSFPKSKAGAKFGGVSGLPGGSAESGIHP
jgi:hypothetical protein